jgi:hypothetical protein
MTDATATITRRLLKVARAATPDQVADGVSWYQNAREFVFELHTAYSGRYSVEQIASVVAVTSPSLRWSANKRATVEFIRAHAAGTPVAEWAYKIRIGENMHKSERILNGDLSALSGPKVTAFYANILGDESHVTVDLWHTHAATGEHRQPRAAERAPITEATRRCALAMGWTPAACQAVIWTVVRGSAE